MLLNFWKSITRSLIILAAKANIKAVQTARERIVMFKQLIQGNEERIDLLEKANIELENATDELQDWIDKNSNGNIIL